eukprot:1150894-Pelagomonas_calceolata.AAC.2
MFAVSLRAVDACPDFLSAFLDMTASISVCPSPVVRNFEHEVWGAIVAGAMVLSSDCRGYPMSWQAKTCRQAKNSSDPQVLEPDPSSDPPDPHQHFLFCSLVVEGTYNSSEPMCPLFLN